MKYWHLILLPLLVIGIPTVLCVKSVWDDLSQKKKQQQDAETRKREQKIDHQNNIGRRIYNALDRLVNRGLMSHIEVSTTEHDEGFVLQVNRHKGGNRTHHVLRVVVSTVGEERQVRVMKNGQLFTEVWPVHEAALEVLIPSLESYVSAYYRTAFTTD